MKKRNIGSSFDDWLREEHLYEEVTSTAKKHALARRVAMTTNQRLVSAADSRPSARIVGENCG
jgi:hypothetical protein